MTPERQERMKRVLDNRQGNLALVLEDVHDPHNIFACLRTADATGVQDVYVILTRNQLGWDAGKRSSASAVKWITLHHFDNVEDCMASVKKHYKRVAGTYLHEDATELYEMDLTQSMALVFGNERYGISEAMHKHLDLNFRIPMKGMVQSLNISVACAVTLYEALRQRTDADLYKQSSLPPDQYQQLESMWKERQLKK